MDLCHAHISLESLLSYSITLHWFLNMEATTRTHLGVERGRQTISELTLGWTPHRDMEKGLGKAILIKGTTVDKGLGTWVTAEFLEDI